MPNDSPNRTVVYVLGGALFASLLVIAFLLGRESSRDADPSGAPQAAPASADGSDAPSAASADPERRWPAWADLDDAAPDRPEPEVTETYAGRIERHQDGRIVLSNRDLDGSSHTLTTDSPTALTPTETSTATTTARANDAGAVVAYFERVDAIRSSNESVDPNAFAMDLIKATMKGSTEGFDELIADGARMQSEMAAIEPPPSCAVYHRESLAAMAQSQAILETMRDAIQSGNIQALTQVTSQASVLQSKAETLDALRQQILASARR